MGARTLDSDKVGPVTVALVKVGRQHRVVSQRDADADWDTLKEDTYYQCMTYFAGVVQGLRIAFREEVS